jgi:hypothetical protein
MFRIPPGQRIKSLALQPVEADRSFGHESINRNSAERPYSAWLLRHYAKPVDQHRRLSLATALPIQSPRPTRCSRTCHEAAANTRIRKEGDAARDRIIAS